MHDFKGYDSHLIVKEAYNINKEQGNKNINAIPNSYEEFMSLSIGQLKFIDSFQFMASSLDKLVKNLYNENSSVKYDNFKLMKQEFGKYVKILCRKAHYPYEWMDDIDKFNFPGLPPQKAFIFHAISRGYKRKKFMITSSVPSLRTTTCYILNQMFRF
jgi:hypothetical protein